MWPRIVIVSCLVLSTAAVIIVPFALQHAFDHLNREDILTVEARRTHCGPESITIREQCASDEVVFYDVGNACTGEHHRYGCWRHFPPDEFWRIGDRLCLRAEPKCTAR